jgi:hypothetical protein
MEEQGKMEKWESGKDNEQTARMGQTNSFPFFPFPLFPLISWDSVT